MAVNKKNLENIKFGYQYTNSSTIFTAFITSADEVSVILFENEQSYHSQEYQMEIIHDNIYQLIIYEDLKNRYYGYKITRGEDRYYCSDPYSWATSTNGKRSYIIDLEKLKNNIIADGKYSDKKNSNKKNAIIYETHIRDFTVKATIENKGKYFGVIEGENDADRISYLKNMGITHIHFLPMQQIATINDQQIYNWGYDPEQYFMPEHSYASNPSNPISAIEDILIMISNLHKNEMSIILDVVYNHTYDSSWHPFEIMAPNVYYRKNTDGSFSNGSGCGNELNTQHEIVRNMIISSLIHWLIYYEVDGFRFDLMALIDRQTMDIISKKLQRVNPNIILYGEPWVGGTTVLDKECQMIKNAQKNMNIAVFNDDYRNALKGDSDGAKHGYIMGDNSQINMVRLGMLGSINYDKSMIGFTNSPFESINYISSHDNLILEDKLIKAGFTDHHQRMQMTKLALGMIIMSFGIPFIQAGTEFMQTKQMDHNSYISGDDINGLDWNLRDKNMELVDWISNIIKIRHSMNCYATFTQDDIKQRVQPIIDDNVVGMQIYDRFSDNNNVYNYILIIANGGLQSYSYKVKMGDDICLLATSSSSNIIDDNIIKLEPSSMMILVQKQCFMD